MDKDTFIAETIFPKNLEADTPRKLRQNVKTVSVFKATRKTSITFCVLGSWAIYMPPYNLARLSALTREAGYYTRVFDFNVDSHYELKEANPDLSDAWNGANYWWWQDPVYYEKIHTTYKPILDKYIDILLEDCTDILGFSLYYTNKLSTRYVVEEIRKRRPDLTIVLGGPECHEKYFKKPSDVDYCFVGESEQNILDFLDAYDKGNPPKETIIGSLYSDTRIDIDSLPYPDYSDYDLTKYWGQNSICAEISRGCIAKCSYCTEVYYWKFRDRGSSTVVDELEYQVKKYNIKFVSFVDSLMNGNIKEFRKFCQELVDRKLGITWWGYARADGRMDLEFYQLMADAGCQGFNYGFETGSDKVLVAINKKNTVAEINQNIINSHKVGMKVSACWVIGAPGEDIEAFMHSFNLLWNHRARIYACSPGPGLGDNYGSLYDDRARYNLNERDKPWLGGWYTLDLKNTKLHRFIRIKLMHIWLRLCKEHGGTIQNVHSVGQITDHYQLTFEHDLLHDDVEYEAFDFNIINSGLGDFADSLMNEVFGFLRLLWRVRGGYSITIDFNKELDHKDFIFALVPDTHTFEAKINFVIDNDGNYSVDNYYKFTNTFRDVIDQGDFEYRYTASGKWSSIKKSQMRKIFYLNKPRILPIESCYSGVSIDDRSALMSIAAHLKDNSTVLEIGAELGGRATIFSRANPSLTIYALEKFESDSCQIQHDAGKSWINQQILDFAKENNVSSEEAIGLVKNVSASFEIDKSGRKAFALITEKYKNINLIPSWTEDVKVDLCFVNHGDQYHIQPWLSSLKDQGILIVRKYNNDITDFLKTHGWNLIKEQESILIFKK